MRLTDQERIDSLQLLEKYKTSLHTQDTGVSPSLSAIKGIKTILFDVYGTLLISASGEVGTVENNASNEIIKQALQLSGINDYDSLNLTKANLMALIKKEHKRLQLKGVPFPEIKITEIWTSLLKNKDPNRKQILETALNYESLTNQTCPMPGSLPLLETLKVKGYPLGIVSNAQFYTPLIMESYGLMPFFNQDLCSWSYLEGRGKPDTALFLPILNKLEKKGIKPEEIVYIGNDMLNDIKTAKDCGCKTVFFSGDLRSYRPRLQEPLVRGIKPDAIITNLLQLETVLAVN